MYTHFMMSDTVVLIAGKDMPEGLEFVRAANASKRIAFISASQAEESVVDELTDTEKSDKPEGFSLKTDKKKPTEFKWNRASPISTRASIINAENSFGRINEAVLIFDAPFYEVLYKANRINHIDFLKSVDEMLVGYVCLATELINYFTKKGGGTLAFVLKGQNISSAPNLFVSIAQNAFIALAENTVRLYTDKQNMRIILIRSDECADSETAPWLFSFISDIASKNIVRWYKVGTKAAGLLGFLR